MAYDDDILDRIYDRTDGYCHICGKKVSYVNYARYGSRGAWEVEHSVPKAQGGTDHLNNLYPACVSCNRRKAARSTRAARSAHDRSRAPYSKRKKEQIRNSNATVSGTLGGLIGTVAGPWGVAVGAVLGARLGRRIDPES